MVNVAYTITGKLRRPENDMCGQCFKPALLEGTVYILKAINGDPYCAPYGKVKGCRDCKTWFYLDSQGNLQRTVIDGVERKNNAPD